MIRGIYIAASAAIAENKRVDVLANNIANINTAGFKRDNMVTESFPEILLSKIDATPDFDTLKNRPATTESDVTLQNDGDMYVASSKSGYFYVETPQGVSRNRSIQFMVNEQGYLTTPQGDYILGAKGRIQSPDGAAVTVDAKGQVIAGGAVIDRLKMSNPLNAIGNLGYGIYVNEVTTDFSQGALNPTGNDFDIALQGKGFFSIETPEGTRYTRDGQFTKNAEGFLVTKEGYKVLGENGPIKVDGKSVAISEKGEVIVDKNKIDTLKVVDFKDYSLLQKQGDGLIKPSIDETPEMFVQPTATVQQGFIEGSNVNSVREMVEMMTVLRSYEASQRMIKAHDDLLGKSVNEIAKV